MTDVDHADRLRRVKAAMLRLKTCGLGLEAISRHTGIGQRTLYRWNRADYTGRVQGLNYVRALEELAEASEKALGAGGQ